MKVCSKCNYENPDDFNICLQCGRQLPGTSEFSTYPESKSSSPETKAKRETAPQIPPGGKVAPPDCTRPDCPKVFPAGHVFCGQCGRPLQTPSSPQTELFSSPKSERKYAKLVLLNPDGSEGEQFPLKGEQIQVGRERGKIRFLEDPYVSPLHATFYYRNETLFIKNENNLNGIFLKIKKPIELEEGDVFLMGKQLLRFEKLDVPEDEPFDEREPAPAMPWGSPANSYWGRLVQLIAGGFEGNCILLGASKIDLGRERGQITFPGDRFISGLHARIYLEDGRIYLSDLQSRNGTFVKIKDSTQLENGDILIIGEQLLKVKYN